MATQTSSPTVQPVLVRPGGLWRVRHPEVEWWALLLKWIAPALCVLIVSGVGFFTTPIHEVMDSHYSLLLSEQLLRNQRFSLDEYFQLPLDPARYPAASAQSLPYQVERVNGHVYYWYSPVGSVLATPLVAAMHLRGVSVVAPDGQYDPRAEERVESLGASLLMLPVAVAFFAMARALLPPVYAVMIGLVGALGSQVWSTASRALWTQTWGVLLLAFIVLILLWTAERRKQLPVALLGALVAGLYLIRPSYSIQVVAISAFVLGAYPRQRFQYVLSLVPWLGAFVLYSLVVFGRPLPSYYSGGTAAGGGYLTLANAPVALLGELISPSRGVLVFLPWLLLVIYLLARYRKELRHRALITVAVACIAGNLASVSVVGPWWGGNSYGPRLLTDSVPWFVLLAVLAVRARLDAVRSVGRRIGSTIAELVAAVVLSVASILVHSRAGTSYAVWWWNVLPAPVDLVPARVWDWRQPQFLAGITYEPVGCTATLAPGWARGDGAITVQTQAAAVALLRATVPDTGGALRLGVGVNGEVQSEAVVQPGQAYRVVPIAVFLRSGANTLSIQLENAPAGTFALSDVHIRLVDAGVDCLMPASPPPA